jgi:hypothetical protein
MTEPTDNELDALILQHWPAAATATLPLRWMRAAFREGLAKWGTPAPVRVEPAQWQKRHQLRTNGEWENTNEHDAKWWRDNSQGWEIRALYTTPQPTQAQAGAVPLTDEQIRAMLNKHPCEDVCGWSYRMGIDDAELHHGIKGADHG